MIALIGKYFPSSDGIQAHFLKSLGDVILQGLLHFYLVAQPEALSLPPPCCILLYFSIAEYWISPSNSFLSILDYQNLVEAFTEEANMASSRENQLHHLATFIHSTVSF